MRRIWFSYSPASFKANNSNSEESLKSVVLIFDRIGLIKKQLRKIKKGITKAIVQLGLFVVDIVIIIMFVLMAANEQGFMQVG